MPSGVNYAKILIHLEETNKAEQNRLKVEKEKQLLMINKINFLKSERIAVTCAYYL